jgi:hypothetical protein
MKNLLCVAFCLLVFISNVFAQDMYDYTKEYVILNKQYVTIKAFNDTLKVYKERALVPTDYIVNRKPNTVLVAGYTTLHGQYVAVVNLKKVTWSRLNNTVIFELTDGTIFTEKYVVTKVRSDIDINDPLNGITQSNDDVVRVLTWSLKFDDFKTVYPEIEIIK